MRLAWQKVTLGGHGLILGVADPQRKYEGVLTAFTSVLLLFTPLILAAATVCGLWLGRRALTPVARITEDARAISGASLSARLAVPNSNDELQQLSETLNAMLERIEWAFARTKQFTADASHELRAPLALIHTAAEYSLRRERVREELVDSMQKVLRESQRTTALINDLLSPARGDTDRETPELRPVDAVPLLRDLAGQATAMAESKNIRISLQLSADALPIQADEPKLRRLLLILVDNAVKFAPCGGCVTIEAGAEPDGVGIPWRTPAQALRRKTSRTSSNASGAPTKRAPGRPAAQASALRSPSKSRPNTTPH